MYSSWSSQRWPWRGRFLQFAPLGGTECLSISVYSKENPFRKWKTKQKKECMLCWPLYKNDSLSHRHSTEGENKPICSLFWLQASESWRLQSTQLSVLSSVCMRYGRKANWRSWDFHSKTYSLNWKSPQVLFVCLCFFSLLIHTCW